MEIGKGRRSRTETDRIVRREKTVITDSAEIQNGPRNGQDQRQGRPGDGRRDGGFQNRGDMKR
ncbi:MAG: hypothetical protein ACLR2O_02750 [Coprococcus sp.]